MDNISFLRPGHNIYIYIYIFKELCMGGSKENQCYVHLIAPEMHLECYIAI